MFFGLIFLGLLRLFFYLWGDFIKILIYIEVLRLVLITIIIVIMKLDFFSSNLFLRCLIFLVCESRIGFVLFIFYIRIENEVVKKLRLIQF